MGEPREQVIDAPVQSEGCAEDASIENARVEIAHMDAAVEEVFRCMLRTACMVAEEPPLGARICATIRMNGEPEGECALEVPVSTGDRITDSLLGSEADWDDETIDDAVGEICNMVAGCLKRRLGLWREGCRISLPSTVRMAAGEERVVFASSIQRSYAFGEDRIRVTLSFFVL